MRLLLPARSLALLLLLAPAAPAAAQVETGTLLVSVHAADTGQPLPGAQVVVQGVGIGGAADRFGVARLGGLRPGALTVGASYLGYASEAAQVVVVAGQATVLRLALAVQPIQLAEVRVRVLPSVLETSGFMHRRRGGFGTFVTREEILRMQPRYLSDVLRRYSGITLTPSHAGTSRASFRGTKGMSECPIQYYVDGTMTAFFNIDEVVPDDVEGLEIYRGAATIPPAFNKGSAMCGVVVIWTRIR